MPEHNSALIAMSGGVDSSAAARLVLERGLRCEGATMRLYCRADRESGRPSGSDRDIADAQAVARRLGIPHHVPDFSADFRREVIEKFIRTYERGGTPNPCIDCNRTLKFSALLDFADRLGLYYVVSGHYARIEQDAATGRFLLKKAADAAKDQSYFLYALDQRQLSRILFPLGNYTKPQVRQLAAELGFANAEKHDSQDICFVPDGDYTAFMEEYTGKTYPGGDFLDTEGRVVGRHRGAVRYTLGQRKGLGLAMGAPVYVCGKDMEKNTVTVGPEALLFSDTLWAENANWIAFETLTEPIRVLAKARSRMTEQPATVYPEAGGGIRVVFDTPQRAATPGQAVVFYDGDTVVGGAVIVR